MLLFRQFQNLHFFAQIIKIYFHCIAVIIGLSTCSAFKYYSWNESVQSVCAWFVPKIFINLHGSSSRSL